MHLYLNDEEYERKAARKKKYSTLLVFPFELYICGKLTCRCRNFILYRVLTTTVKKPKEKWKNIDQIDCKEIM